MLKNAELKTFPYDWRLDLNETAEALHRFLQANAQGKTVIIVGHSTDQSLREPRTSTPPYPMPGPP